MATAHIGLGSNQGDRREALDAALRLLGESGGIRVVRVSGYHETAPVGPSGNAFLNAAAELETELDPQALLGVLQRIERDLGRRRGRRWGTRRIDLDLLLQGDMLVETDSLTVPHPLLHSRSFVLEPLAEIAPDCVHPILGKTIAELLAALRVRLERGGPTASCRLAVAGPIAAGKTTLALRLAARMELVPFLEQCRRNPLLGRFYADRARYALSTQLWFLLERAAQCREAQQLHPCRFVTDYAFDKDRIFAAQTLGADECAIYDAIRPIVVGDLPDADLVIYLAAGADTLVERAKRRGRPSEAQLDAGYLAALSRAYEEWFTRQGAPNTIRIQVEEWSASTFEVLMDDIAARCPAERWCSK